MDTVHKNSVGFNPVILRADDPHVTLRTKRHAREIRCENCERVLARVQNFLNGNSLASVEIACECGLVTALTMIATLRRVPLGGAR